ncbi:PadR family transcriptional regulator [Actinomadura rayongensis]|uniref:PadR family transcriptional regulator n=1 Tax=Actinomadura rayongensis TaxID=1429076 RepID=A0A6I4WAU6_9ACTN|nr:PadR family transcriptional regulator [Actinomadura rayongensis]MXQ64194.1 PadR family transcriptional regulator [Actinomadura rayongensis]
MSLRYGLLGLLAEGPASGYDLARRFQEVLSSIWPAQHPKIYAELRRLTAEGLIEVDSQGPRGRTAYRITGDGLAALRHWLAEEDVDRTMRLQPLLRSLFFWLMDPDELNRHLAREAEYYAGMAEAYRAYAARKDAGEFGDAPPVQSMRVTIEAAVRLFDALADWARWAADRPPAAAPPGGQG